MTATLDEFTIGAKLGQGLTAKVYWAKKDDGRDYALKVFKHDNPLFNRESFARIQSEFQLSADLNNENVVKFHGFRAEAMMQKPNKSYRVSYIIQELITGGELYDYVENSGFFKPEFVRYFSSQILKGVLFMHSKGVVHRDLKCSNILLDNEYKIKIVDLGFAKPVTGDQGTGLMQSLVGTQDHMAPQIHEGRAYRGSEVDLFAVGVIIFTLYAGHPPFDIAKQDDAFYKWLHYGQAREFWARHEKYHSAGFFDPKFKELMTLMLSYHPTNRPTIADIIAHPWLREGPVASEQDIREELCERERVNKEKVAQAKQNSQKSRRDVELEQDPYQAQRELEEIENELQDYQIREFDTDFAIKRMTTLFSLKEPLILFREVKRALRKE